MAVSIDEIIRQHESYAFMYRASFPIKFCDVEDLICLNNTPSDQLLDANIGRGGVVAYKDIWVVTFFSILTLKA